MAERTLAANKTAQEATRKTRWQARDIVEKAPVLIEEAQANAAKFLTEQALGTAGEAPVSIKAVRVAAQDAQDALDAAISAGVALAKQEATEKYELQYAKGELDAAVRGVMRDEGSATIDRILVEAAALQEQLGAKRVLLSFLGSECFEQNAEERRPIADFLTEPVFPWVWNNKSHEHPVLAPWRAAREALRQSADAALPI
jgi:hypothetical protein